MSGRVIDAAGMKPRELNRLLRESSGDVEIVNPNSMHFMAAGLKKNLRIKVIGSVGYYLGTCMHGPEIHVTGNAGWYPGDNITEGRIVIDGLAGDGVGQGMYGGTVVVKGDCGSRVGQLMKNGTIIIGGNTDYMTGLYAFGGRIIVCGDTGDATGESLIGGTIYVGGKIKSLGKNAKIDEVSEEEKEKINKLLEEVGLKPLQKITKVITLGERMYKVDMGEG
ncbi:MAG: GXGXG domain-containing protein [Candidatus Hadarchaeales archaeon]